MIRNDLGRTARLLDLRPPLYNGGHTFVMLDEAGAVWWCVGCYRPLPRWALDEGFVTTLLGRWCPALFRAIGPAHASP